MNLYSRSPDLPRFDTLTLTKELGAESDRAPLRGPVFPMKVGDEISSLNVRRRIIDSIIAEHKTMIVDCNFTQQEASEVSLFARHADPINPSDSVIKFRFNDSNYLAECFFEFFTERGFQGSQLNVTVDKIAKAVCDLAYGLHRLHAQFDFVALPCLTPLHMDNFQRFLNATIVGEYHTHYYSLAALHLNLPGPCYIFHQDVRLGTFQEYITRNSSVLKELQGTSHSLDMTATECTDDTLLDRWKILQKEYIDLHQHPNFLRPAGEVYQIEAHQGLIISEGLYHRSPFLFMNDLKDGAGVEHPTQRFYIDIVGI